MRTKQVKIGYAIYKLLEQEHVELLRSPAKGLIEHDRLAITLETDQSLPEKFQSLMHELTHGIADMYDVELDEVETNRIATGVAIFIVDNLPLVEELVKMVKRSLGLPVGKSVSDDHRVTWIFWRFCPKWLIPRPTALDNPQVASLAYRLIYKCRRDDYAVIWR